MKRNLSLFAGILMVVIYLAFAFLAKAGFPGRYSPLQNWLSDLGSFQLNPKGALFYNLGIVLAGALLLPFFSGLGACRLAGNRTQNAMLLLTQIFGALGAFAMVMSAVFPISVPGVHSILSAALYILLGTAFGFSVAALRYYPRYPKWALAAGVLVAIEDMLWGMVLNIYIMEWVTVALFLAYVLLLAVETKRLQGIQPPISRLRQLAL